ncbi:MAG TPA: Ig-like domain-containing protein [Verrucomicrobiae bacterium]
MKQHKRISLLAGLMIAAASSAHGQTLWSGPNTSFNKTASGQSDTILAGSVVLTRGGNQVLYNTAAKETSAGATSPKGTEWAFGDLSGYNTLTYSSMEALRNNGGGDFSAYITNKPMVLHLMSSNIYLSITFVSWQMQGGDFHYIRSTPSVSLPTPTVSITNPVSGSILVAPASVNIQAAAAVSSGTVTNVSFYSAGSLLGSSPANPFSFTVNNLGAGPYQLTAVATASGVSATSAVVSITVIPPAPSVTITNPVTGAAFTAPANLSLGASASVASGTVTNVTFFAGTTPLGTALASPFALTSGVGLGAGSYGLTAVATAGGVSTTSAVVNITVTPPAPTVALTAPAANAVFAAPVNLSVAAAASVPGGGTVTNVSFFANSILLGTALGSPFSLTSGPSLGAGNYGLTAVATAGGVSATSAVVNVFVVTPVVVTNSAPSVAGGHFSFNYAANMGLVYVIKGSSDLIHWTPLATNTASGGSVTFTDPSALGSQQFYEVVLQANP